MKRKIDKMPPTLTGNAATDVKAMSRYLAYLVEQINWIISLLDRDK